MSLLTTGEDDVDEDSSCSGEGDCAMLSASMPFSSVSVVCCCESMVVTRLSDINLYAEYAVRLINPVHTRRRLELSGIGVTGPNQSSDPRE